MSNKQAYLTGYLRAINARTKTAQSSHGYKIRDTRQLSEEEEAAIAKNKRNWIPKIFETRKTPAAEMMSSPGKGALLHALLLGLPMAGIGAGYGGAMGAAGGDAGRGAGIGAAALGIPSALLAAFGAYKGRSVGNEDLKDIMERMPKGQTATVKDVELDPVQRARLQRQAIMAGGGY